MRIYSHRGLGVLPGLLFLFTTHACAQATPNVDNTAFLTWHDDPTTTMVAQWLELGQLPAMMPGSSDDASFATPRLPGPIVIDGEGDDWGIHGLRLDYLAQPNGEWPDPIGFAATAKLGWTPDGVAVLIHVVDDEATEAQDAGKLWEADGVELFLGIALDDPRAGQFVITPGLDPIVNPDIASGKTLVRSAAYARDENMPQKIAVQAASVKTDDGYVIEALVPWNILGENPKPETGDTFTFQLIVNDQDGEFGRDQLAWYPAVDSYQNRQAMQTIRLADAPGTTVRMQVLPRYDTDLGQLVLDLGGEPRLIGERVVIRSGELEITTVTLEDVLGFAGAVAAFPVDDAGRVQRVDAISVHLDDGVVGRVLLPADTWRKAPDSVTVQRLGEVDNTVVELDTQLVPFGHTGWYVHRVSMTGLTPDSEYLLDIPGSDDPLLFRTAPATLDKPLVFAEGGDVGTAYAVSQLHDQAAAWDPLFGLVGGDCAYANGVDPDKWVDYLQLWREHMITADGRSIPMLCTIGNHEVEGSYGQEKEQAPFFYALFGPLYPNRGAYNTLDFSDYLSLILLDSGHTARHAGQQTKWLDQALTERADFMFRYTAYHVPAYPSHRAFDGKYSSRAREHWVPLFEKHKITASFEHHDHTYKRTHLLLNDEPHPDGILYLGDGAWGRTPRSVNPDLPYLAVAKSKMNVIRVELSPDGEASYRAVDEMGRELDRYPETKDGE